MFVLYAFRRTDVMSQDFGRSPQGNRKQHRDEGGDGVQQPRLSDAQRISAARGWILGSRNEAREAVGASASARAAGGPQELALGLGGRSGFSLGYGRGLFRGVGANDDADLTGDSSSDSDDDVSALEALPRPTRVYDLTGLDDDVSGGERRASSGAGGSSSSRSLGPFAGAFAEHDLGLDLSRGQQPRLFSSGLGVLPDLGIEGFGQGDGDVRDDAPLDLPALEPVDDEGNVIDESNIQNVMSKFSNVKARYFCFTSFSTEPPKMSGSMRYLIFSREVGRQGGHHWQGYVEFRDDVRLNAARKVLGNGLIHKVYAERRSGTAEQAIAYVKKDKPETDVFEYGEVTVDKRKSKSNNNANGEPSEYAKLLEAEAAGMRLSEIAVNWPTLWVHKQNGIRNLRAQRLLNAKHEPRKPEVMCFYGDSGVGKTSGVQKLLTEAGLDVHDVYAVRPTVDGKLWFDFYDGEKVLVIDDFDGKCSITDYLQLTDYRHNQCVWPMKGSQVRVNFEKIYITSNFHPSTWWPGQEHARKTAILRRIDRLFEGRFVQGRPVITQVSTVVPQPNARPIGWAAYQNNNRM